MSISSHSQTKLNDFLNSILDDLNLDDAAVELLRRDILKCLPRNKGAWLTCPEVIQDLNAKLQEWIHVLSRDIPTLSERDHLLVELQDLFLKTLKEADLVDDYKESDFQYKEVMQDDLFQDLIQDVQRVLFELPEHPRDYTRQQDEQVHKFYVVIENMSFHIVRHLYYNYY